MSGQDTPIRSGSPPTLKRTMGLFALTIYGVGDMLGAGIYALIGTAAGVMGNVVWLGFVAAALAAMFTGLSYAALGSRYPRAAGAAYVVQQAFGSKLLAYTLGLMTMASGLTSLAAGANAFSEQLHRQVVAVRPRDAPPPMAAQGPQTATAPHAPSATWWQSWTGRMRYWPWILGYLAVLTFINFWGMREATWMNALCTIIEVGGLLIVIAVGISYWGSVDYLQTPVAPGGDGQTPLTLPLVLSGGVLVFYAFVGFEDMLNVTEEVKDVERVFPRALVLAVVITTVIYLLVAITAVSVVPYRELARPGASLVNVVEKAAPWFPKGIFAAISLFAIANTGLLNYIMGSRIVYGMARQGLLPAFLGRLHPVRRTPHVAIMALLAIVILLALSGGVADLASATSLLLLVVFGVVNVALIVLKSRPGEPRGRFDVPWIVPATGALVCACLVASRLYTSLASTSVSGRSPPWLAPLLAAIMAAGIIGLYFVMKPRDLSDKGPAA